jgi:hypothetical protein
MEASDFQGSTGYRDRFTWYATMFGVAIIGIVNIITSIIQTAVAFLALALSQKAYSALAGIDLQRLQMNQK